MIFGCVESSTYPTPSARALARVLALLSAPSTIVLRVAVSP